MRKLRLYPEKMLLLFNCKWSPLFGNELLYSTEVMKLFWNHLLILDDKIDCLSILLTLIAWESLCLLVSIILYSDSIKSTPPLEIIFCLSLPGRAWSCIFLLTTGDLVLCKRINGSGFYCFPKVVNMKTIFSEPIFLK